VLEKAGAPVEEALSEGGRGAHRCRGGVRCRRTRRLPTGTRRAKAAGAPTGEARGRGGRGVRSSGVRSSGAGSIDRAGRISRLGARGKGARGRSICWTAGSR
jgi:hypothetical protein